MNSIPSSSSSARVCLWEPSTFTTPHSGCASVILPTPVWGGYLTHVDCYSPPFSHILFPFYPVASYAGSPSPTHLQFGSLLPKQHAAAVFTPATCGSRCICLIWFSATSLFAAFPRVPSTLLYSSAAMPAFIYTLPVPFPSSFPAPHSFATPPQPCHLPPPCGSATLLLFHLCLPVISLPIAYNLPPACHLLLARSLHLCVSHLPHPPSFSALLYLQFWLGSTIHTHTFRSLYLPFIPHPQSLFTRWLG